MYIDSHCHLPHKKYKMDTVAVVTEAMSEGVERLVAIGTSLKENELAIKTAQKFPGVYCTVGIYPHEDIGLDVDKLRLELEKQLKTSQKIVGIGECGIDITNWKGGRPLLDQRDLFEMQLNLALGTSLPIVVHNRNGSDHIFELVKKVGASWLRGVAHCFSSTWEDAKRFLDLGFYISFSGNITYPSAQERREVVKKTPLEKILIETDSPYLPPQRHRGEPNYPKYVKIVAEKVAEIKQIPIKEVEDATAKNTCRLFQIK
jgi:TatD DNase family protein